MAVVKLKCPDCGLALNPAKRPEPGKKIKCPRCANIFRVPAADDELEIEEPAPPKKVAAKKANPAIKKPTPGKAPAVKPTSAPGKPAPAAVDDEAGVYGLKTNPEDEEKEKDDEPAIN